MKKVERIFFNEDTVEVSYGFTGDDKGTWFLEHCELMQFVCAFDDNNVRMFEGDILECIGESEYLDRTGRYVCIFGSGYSFVLQPLERFNIEHSNIGLPIDWGGFQSKKIIGNIFEHPELLKESP